MSSAVLVICAAVGSICAGAAAASFFILLGARVLRRPCGKHRFVSVCLLLSAVVVFASVFIIKLPAAFVFEKEFFPFAYYAGLFLLGVLISCFYKFAVPLTVSLYIIYVLVTVFFLYSRFGTQKQEMRITISAGQFVADGETFYMETDSEYRYAVVDVYTLKPELLLPFRNSWCRFAGFSDIRDFGNEDFSVLDRICAEKVRYYIEIPVSGVASALYIISYTVSGRDLIYSLERVL